MEGLYAFIREARLSDDEVDASEYPFNLPAIAKLGTLTFTPGVTFIIGENGAGKSTLIEAIAAAYGLNPEGGSRDTLFATSQTHSVLHDRIKIVRGAIRPKDSFFLRAESFYNYASSLKKSYGGKSIGRRHGPLSLHDQSHGQSFMALIRNRLTGDGMYIMDEPEAALSIRSQMELLSEFGRLVSARSQLIVATHSPILLSYPGALIYNVTDDGFNVVSYEETDQYQLAKYFLGNYKHILSELLL